MFLLYTNSAAEFCNSISMVRSYTQPFLYSPSVLTFVKLSAVEYTGGIPYSLLKPVLDGATPAQLFQFEHFNPYIIEDTDHLWKFHVNKEFRSEQRQEFESWRDMYLVEIFYSKSLRFSFCNED